MVDYFLQSRVPIPLGAASCLKSYQFPILGCLVTGNVQVLSCQWFRCRLMFGDSSGSLDPYLALHSWVAWQCGLVVRAVWGALGLRLSPSTAWPPCKKRDGNILLIALWRAAVGGTPRHCVRWAQKGSWVLALAVGFAKVFSAPQPYSHLCIGSCSGGSGSTPAAPPPPAPREEELEGLGQVQG